MGSHLPTTPTGMANAGYCGKRFRDTLLGILRRPRQCIRSVRRNIVGLKWLVLLGRGGLVRVAGEAFEFAGGFDHADDGFEALGGQAVGA